MKDYRDYLTARANGWLILRGFHHDTKNLKPDQIVERDGIAFEEVTRLRLAYQRLVPCAGLAEELGLSLDVLQVVSKNIGKLHRAGTDILAEMLNACVGKNLREAEAAIDAIVKQHVQPGTRKPRMNIAKQADEHGMLYFNGSFTEAQGREIQAKAQPFIKSQMAKNDNLRYDHALAVWAVKQMLGESGESPEYQPMIIMASDPNIDATRGHLNTLSGGAVPLADAVNERLAGTGYVALTRQDDNGVHLDAIVPIVRERMSTGPHRLGVVLENLVCAHPDCDRPAITCQAHHINSVAYHQGETSWDNLVAACRPHNARNDDNPGKAPRNGRLERDEKGWVGHRAHPGAPLRHNPNPKFREGYRGTTEEMYNNRNF